MPKHYKITKLVLPAFLLFTFSLLAQTPDFPSEVEGVSTSWWSQVQKDLAQKEYVVNYDAKGKSYREFNRKNGIISSLNSGKFSLKPTLDSGQTEYAWHTSLETASIEFDGVSTYQAKHTSTATQNNNTVEFNHKDFTEQYVNTQQGIRQNFILHQGPKANQVRIKVKVNGLSLNKRNDNEIALYEKNKGGIQTHLLYKDIKSWDANGLVLASKLDVEGEHIVLVVNTKGAVYPITIDPISTTASTTLEENQAGAYLGFSVSSAGDVNGDGYSDVIVGAGYYTNGQTNEGGAFIYHGSASGISTTASTSLEENQAGAYFGISVSSAGDVNGDGYSDVIVGARFYDNGQTKEGVAFIYHGSSSGISTTANTTLEENQPSAYLGRSVSGAGDVNGDGYSDVIVGAYAYGNGGGAFIYRGSSCRNEFRDTIIGCQLYTWTNGVTYTASDTIAKDTFVNAVGCDSIVTLNLTIIKADEYITTQPSDQSVVPSTDVGFTIGSSISTGVKYQWQMDVGLGFQLMSNAGQYSGTQSDSLKVSGVTISNDNQLFKCIVTANDCSDTSDVATLTIDRVNISEISKDQIFHIYPNPTNEIIHIQVNAEHIGISYTILSSIGVKVLEGEIKELDATVNIVDLQEGIYFVQIGEDLRQIFKIIKK